MLAKKLWVKVQPLYNNSNSATRPWGRIIIFQARNSKVREFFHKDSQRDGNHFAVMGIFFLIAAAFHLSLAAQKSFLTDWVPAQIFRRPHLHINQIGALKRVSPALCSRQLCLLAGWKNELGPTHTRFFHFSPPTDERHVELRAGWFSAKCVRQEREEGEIPISVEMSAATAAHPSR
jgi:hypothetical protein